MLKSERRFKYLQKILASTTPVPYFIEKNARDTYNLFIKKSPFVVPKNVNPYLEEQAMS